MHDICYGTCNRDKIECDIEFKNCLFIECGKVNYKRICENVADLMNEAVFSLGCSFYLNSQLMDCKC